MVQIPARLWLRRGIQSLWNSVNPVLALGEPASETDTGRLKVGDGVTPYNSLRSHLSVPSSAVTAAQALLDATTAANQRVVLGLPSDLSALNAVGGDAINIIADWDEVHAGGSNFYRAFAGKANAPEAVLSYAGYYSKYNANAGVLRISSLTGSRSECWVRIFNITWGGWFRIGASDVFTPDWDLATSQGSYWGSSATLNGPAALFYYGHVIRRDDTQIIQTLYGAASDAMWFRRRVAGVWQPWREVIHTGNIASQLVFTEEYVSPEQAIVAGGPLTLLHGLTGGAPKEARAFVICKIAQHGYAVGQIIPVDNSFASNVGLQLHWDTTNIFGRFGSNAIYQMPAGGGAWTPFTPANWRIIIRAWK